MLLFIAGREEGDMIDGAITVLMTVNLSLCVFVFASWLDRRYAEIPSTDSDGLGGTGHPGRARVATRPTLPTAKRHLSPRK